MALVSAPPPRAPHPHSHEALVEASGGSSREIRIIPSHKARPGPHLYVDRPFPGPLLDSVGPFIMLDHYGPEHQAPGGSGRVNPHPHSGIEAVSMLLEGDARHCDSLGNVSVMNVGDVQWMHAGSGIIHDETPGPRLLAMGGQLEGLQIWVNQPAEAKLAEPAYFFIAANTVPTVWVQGGRLRVIAGSWKGRTGPAESSASLLMLHGCFEAGASVSLPAMPEGWEIGVYAMRGALHVANASLQPRQLAVWQSGAPNEGGTAHEPEVALSASEPSQFLVLAGPRIDEPRVSYGPFVASSSELLMKAQRDYASGRMGTLKGVPF